MSLLGQGWDDPQSQAIMALAGGLLSGDFGRGAKDYGNVMAGAKDKDLQRQLLKSQLDENISQAALRAQQAKQAEASQEAQKQKMDMLSQMFGGGISPGAFTPSGGMGPTMPPSMQQQSGIGGLNIDKVAQLKAMHGVDLMDAFKWANDPLKMEQGSTYLDRKTGQERYMPKVGEGVAPNAGGFYGELPGYGAAQASIEGQKAGAIEKAKAGFDPLTYTPKGSGNPIMSNRAAVMSQPGVTGSGYAGGNRDSANADSIKILMAELQNPQYDASVKAGITREIQRLQQQSGMTGGIELQSEAEKVGQVDTAKANVVRDTAKQGDAKRYSQLTATADRALTLLKSGPTNSGLGSMVDSAAGFFGQSTKGADAAAELNTLSGWMTANVPRMEGPQSDKDVAQYKIMAAAAGEKTLPVSQRIAAVKELKLLQDKYADLNGYAAQSGGATGDFGKSSVKAPMKGMVQGGYKFKGGNPADPANWEKQ